MIIKINKPPVYYIWLPVYLYNEPMSLRYFISFFEIILYLFTFYVVTINLITYLKIRMFHRNFIIISIPMFGLWYELILAKLITMAYQLELIRADIEVKNFLPMWTDNEEKMLITESTDNLGLLILAGCIQWHYMFVTVFGVLTCTIERLIGCFMIRNYEKNTNPWIPIILTFLHQFLAILFSFLLITCKIDVISANLTWIINCSVAAVMYVYVRRRNLKTLRIMESPNRKVHFTVSHRFQVREVERFAQLAIRLIFSVLGSITICGTCIVALILELVPPFLCHFAENCLFLNPLLICFVTMYSLPAWKQEFRSAFPTFDLKRNERKIGVISVEPMESDKKKIDKETDIYFEQLNKSWI